MVLLGALSPDITLLIGFVSDIMNGSFRFSVTSLVGIFAVILHWIIGKYLFGYTAPAAQAISQVATVVRDAVIQSPIQEVVNIAVGKDPAPAPARAPAPAPARAPAPAPAPAPAMSLISGIRGNPAGATMIPSSSGQSSTVRRAINDRVRPTRAAAVEATARMQRQRAAQGRNRSPSGSASQTGSGESSVAYHGEGGASYIQEKFNPCTIRGLGMFELTNSPMGMAALSSVFMIYLLDMLSKRSGSQVGIYISFATIVLGLNLYAYKEAKCVADTSVTGLLKGIALPTVLGLASGGIAYGVMKSNYPEFLPLDAEPYDGTPGKKQAKCGKPSDNEFVCDAYKDGKRISTTVLT
jgi:hypothetical protein